LEDLAVPFVRRYDGSMSEPTLPRSVLDAVDISEITQLILTERESRDFGHWSRMRDCFHDCSPSIDSDPFACTSARTAPWPR
jgi:hypothetical protein